MLAFARLNVLMIFFMSLIIKAVLHASRGFLANSYTYAQQFDVRFCYSNLVGAFPGVAGKVIAGIRLNWGNAV